MIHSRTDKRQAFRKQLWTVMHNGSGRTGRAFHFTSVMVIILSVAILPLELLPGTERYADTLFVIDAVFVGIFTVEYALRIYAAPNRLRYVFSGNGIIDLLSIATFYGGFILGEFVRLFRLVRIFKILGIRGEIPKDKRTLQMRNIDLMQGEVVEYIVRRHPVFLLFSAVPPLVSFSFGIGILIVSDINPVSVSISIALILFSFVFLWNGWRDFAYDVIYLTNMRLIFQDQHLLGRSISHVDYRQIISVKPFYPHVLSFLLRYGSITIDTAAEAPGQIQLDTVRKHEKAAHLIMQKSLQ